MAAADKKASIADALDEQYYQINLDILESFSKYRPPLNLYPRYSQRSHAM